jgi:hypothetical protein
MVTRQLVINLNKDYHTGTSIPKDGEQQPQHRPIGTGGQGLADVFTTMGVSFDSRIFRYRTDNLPSHVSPGEAAHTKNAQRHHNFFVT